MHPIAIWKSTREICISKSGRDVLFAHVLEYEKASSTRECPVQRRTHTFLQQHSGGLLGPPRSPMFGPANGHELGPADQEPRLPHASCMWAHRSEPIVEMKRNMEFTQVGAAHARRLAGGLARFHVMLWAAASLGRRPLRDVCSSEPSPRGPSCLSSSLPRLKDSSLMVRLSHPIVYRCASSIDTRPASQPALCTAAFSALHWHDSWSQQLFCRSARPCC